MSEHFHELTQILEIKISHASLKHPQTIGVVERDHTAPTRILKLTINQTFTNWHKYLNLATFIHPTSYHTSIVCAPTVTFRGRDPVEPLDIRFYSNCIQKSAFNYDFVESLRDEMLKEILEYKREPREIFQQIQEVLRPEDKGKSTYRTHNMLFAEPPTHRTISFQPEIYPKMACSV